MRRDRSGGSGRLVVHFPGIRGMMLGMRFCRFVGVVIGMREMGMCEMRVMAGMFGLAIMVMGGRIAMMFGCFFQMRGCVFVMFGGANRRH